MGPGTLELSFEVHEERGVEFDHGEVRRYHF